jgi:hypothetical protein
MSNLFRIRNIIIESKERQTIIDEDLKKFMDIINTKI